MQSMHTRANFRIFRLIVLQRYRNVRGQAVTSVTFQDFDPLAHLPDQAFGFEFLDGTGDHFPHRAQLIGQARADRLDVRARAQRIPWNMRSQRWSRPGSLDQ